MNDTGFHLQMERLSQEANTFMALLDDFIRRKPANVKVNPSLALNLTLLANKAKGYANEVLELSSAMECSLPRSQSAIVEIARTQGKTCARTACQNPHDWWFNRSTNMFYCEGCKKRISEVPDNAVLFSKIIVLDPKLIMDDGPIHWEKNEEGKPVCVDQTVQSGSHIEDLNAQIERLRKLQADPQPGLFTWNQAMRNVLKDIHITTGKLTIC
jgi:hypothetical protein